jgi:hypothetical protein
MHTIMIRGITLTTKYRSLKWLIIFIKVDDRMFRPSFYDGAAAEPKTFTIINDS